MTKKDKFKVVSDGNPKYEVNRKDAVSPGRELIKNLPSRKNLLIYHEIFDKPLSLRAWE